MKLKDLVEHTYAENNNSRVVLIAHSMGAPMGMLFLHGVSQEWKDKHIDCLVTLSGAWGGSAKAIKVFAIGKYINRAIQYCIIHSTLEIA